MDSTEIKQVVELKELIKELSKKVDKNNDMTETGFKTMNGRVKTLELYQARQEGIQSVNRPVNINWTKIIIAIVSVATAALSLAALIVNKLVV